MDVVEIISQLLYHNNATMELKKCQWEEVMVETEDQALS